MKRKLLLAGLLFSVSATQVMAAGPYVGLSGGVSLINDSNIVYHPDPTTRNQGAALGGGAVEYNAGYAFNVAGGYDFDPLRVEAEFGYKNAGYKNELSAYYAHYGIEQSHTDLTVMSYMVNAYYDFKNRTPVSPFIGAGIGLLHGELREPEGNNLDDNSFGYQFSVGAAYQLNKNLNLDLSYRFQGAASDFAQDRKSISYHSNNVMAGIRYNF